MQKSQPIKTKWQQMLDSQKGYTTYNPSQAFALHVFWLVRSPKAAKEMIEEGFKPCASATKRDTPTTITYFFRVSYDQTIAREYKSEIKLLSQHPHYKPAFKFLAMGLSREDVERRLKSIDVDVKPLDWGDTEIEGRESMLDFDPVLIECTEIYLDDRSFYEHAASREWMKFSAEILKPNRSLRPKTYCVGNPSKDIWEKALESSLKAIRFEGKQNEIMQTAKPGLFLGVIQKEICETSVFFFLEIDSVVKKHNLQKYRSCLDDVHIANQGQFMIVFPTNIDPESEPSDPETVAIRYMTAFEYLPNMKCLQLGQAKDLCQQFKGRLVITTSPDIQKHKDYATDFLNSSDIQANVTVEGTGPESGEARFAGYYLHPSFNILKEDLTLKYQI